MARAFNGSTDKIICLTTPITAAPLSIACWFLSTSSTTNQALVSIGDTGGGSYFYLKASGTVAGDPIEFGTSGPVASTSTGYSTNKWTHAAGVSSAANSRAAYINGGSKGTDLTSSTPTGLDAVGLGCLHFAADTIFLAGNLAEVGIWNVALSDADVLALSKGYPPPAVKPKNLVFYSPLIGRSSPEIELISKRTLTVTGATQAAHPRMTYLLPPLTPSFTATAPFYLEQEEPWKAEVTVDRRHPPAWTDEGVSTADLKNFPLWYEDEVVEFVRRRTEVPWDNRTFLDEAVDLTALVNLPVAEEHDWVRARQDVPWLPVAFPYDEISTDLKLFFLDQEDDHPKQVQIVPWNPVPFLDEEPPASGLALFGLDQEDFGPLLGSVETVAWLPVVLTDEEVTGDGRNFPTDQEEPWRPAVTVIDWRPRPSLDDEVGVGLLGFGLDLEEPFRPLTEAVAWTAVDFRDDEVGSDLRLFYLDQEEPWRAAVTLVPVAFPVYSDDEVTGDGRNFPYETETAWTGAVTVVSWNPWVGRDDEVTGAGVNLPLDHEQTGPLDLRPFPPPQQASRDDETGAGFTLFGIDLEDWPTLALSPQERPWEAPRLLGQEEAVVAPVLEQEDGTWLLVAVTTLPLPPPPFLDDEVGAGLRAFGLEDERRPWVEAGTPTGAFAVWVWGPGDEVAPGNIIPLTPTPLADLYDPIIEVTGAGSSTGAAASSKTGVNTFTISITGKAGG